jgi:hypothetical protein
LAGAPAALACSLGLKAVTNGIAAPITAPVPTIEVAAIKNFLLPGLEGGFGCILSF